MIKKFETVERQIFKPDRLSSRALRFLLEDLVTYSDEVEDARIEEARARIEYELRLREGQGE